MEIFGVMHIYIENLFANIGIILQIDTKRGKIYNECMQKMHAYFTCEKRGGESIDI